MSFYLSKAAIRDLHGSMHESLDIVLDLMGRMPQGSLATKLAGFGHATIREQITHVLTTEARWVRALQLLPVRQYGLGNLATMDDFRRAKKDVSGSTIAYLDSLSDEKLNSELETYSDEWIGPRRCPAFILMHVITHSFHHKGQIVAMLRLLGYPAPDTDMQRE
jgi:uncharacterized damage-inducible protein DinB